MCGIAGICNVTENQPVSRNAIERMTQIIKHRGPDDYGIFCDRNVGLGHRRLSIVDLSEGKQPMCNEDGTVWVCYNGEIYNHSQYRGDLEKRGHLFKTRCDTEILIHLYEEFGEELLHRINGMYAFVIWDQKKNKLFAARDRMGIKPFYYTVNKGRFFFASEIKSILVNGDIERKLDNTAFSEYFSFYTPLEDRTFFKNISLLEPGHYITIENGKFLKRKYWDITDYEKLNISEPLLVEKFQDLFEDAVRIRLMSDVPVGAYLSGGIDSSSIAVIASKHYSGTFQTFTAGFNEGRDYDETEYAQTVADIIKSQHHQLYIDGNQFPELLPKLIWYLDEPRIGAAIFPQYFISKLASQHVKVCLGGQGCDEVFAGYARYFYGTLYRNLTHIIIKKFLGSGSSGSKVGSNIQKQLDSQIISWLKQNYLTLFSPYKKRYYNQFRLLNDEIQSMLFCEEFKHSLDFKQTYSSFLETLGKCGSGNPLDKLLYWDTKTYLNGLLMLEDRMSMANSLESRVPFLDYRIVEFAFKLPSQMKLNGLTTKYIIKQSVAKYLPEKILNKRKMGFPTPIGKWFEGIHREWVKDIIFDTKFKQRGIFNTEFVISLLDGKYKDNRYWERIIWTVLNVELWHRLFIDGNSEVFNYPGKCEGEMH
ncbi:MAG: hypothetical protein JL50_11330 [Peptococcaceae bacterium BICA1-7]|nr:MAG: hypothetical protein JL50_11330 [Peptococcaceae bacterium BICA1-7]